MEKLQSSFNDVLRLPIKGTAEVKPGKKKRVEGLKQERLQRPVLKAV
jgi:hypothetical protein